MPPGSPFGIAVQTECDSARACVGLNYITVPTIVFNGVFVSSDYSDR